MTPMPADDVAPPIGVILAGGKSTRMGVDKALLRIPRDDSPTLLDRAAAALRKAGLATIVLSVSDEARGLALQEANVACANGPLVYDAQPGRGPMGGLDAALTAYPGRGVLLVACDMPDLAADAVHAVLAHARKTGADVVLPLVEGRPEPLHAYYGPRCAPIVARLLAFGRYKMSAIADAPALLTATIAVAPASTRNLNTPDDVASFLAARGGGAYG